MNTLLKSHNYEKSEKVGSFQDLKIVKLKKLRHVDTYTSFVRVK